MNDKFSIREYLVSNNLTDQEGELIAGPGLDNPDWGIGPHAQPETIIRLCALVYFFEREGMLNNLRIAIRNVEVEGYKDLYYRIDIDRINKHEFSNFQWDIVLDTIDLLEQYMASSNISYLAGGLFSEN